LIKFFKKVFFKKRYRVGSYQDHNHSERFTVEERPHLLGMWRVIAITSGPTSAMGLLDSYQEEVK
jgi:hypothetical protein